MELVASPCCTEFIVVELPESQENWLALRKTVKCWSSSAKEKMFESEEKRLDSEQFRAAMNIADTICLEITKVFFPGLRGEIAKKDWDTLFICHEGDVANVRGVALFSKKKGSLKAIVTHPDNIKHPLNKGSIRGVGTTIVRALAEVCITLNVPLTLTSHKTAIIFYERLGFKRETDSPAPFMQLSTKKCKDLIA